MKFISLFTGIGGLDLGLERAGMECVAQVEIDPYCQRILNRHWPDVPKWEDIHEIQDGELPFADLIAGGFPCQPVSQAGRREGADDDRWLWPEFFRVVRMVRPRYVLVENVPGLITRGFGEVATDLARGGYDFEWTRLSAAAVGAPHLRQRIFIVAYPSGVGTGVQPGHSEPGGPGREPTGALEPTMVRPGNGKVDAERVDAGGAHVADPNSGGLEIQRVEEHAALESEPGDQPDGRGEGRRGTGTDVAHTQVLTVGPGLRPCSSPRQWGRRPTDLCCPYHTWDVEPDVGRVANGIPRRVDRLKALGNAVVPQVAEHIGQLIMEAQ